MYLKKLEILGFKSFQQRTMINFNHGLTAVVGPNGCGKTNIVDAIRWSLGEQKSSTLRSDKMENVIFNGTANKKPMGMAEVSLTIENDRGILPTEYSEVSITRRIFRSGESEYLLNKNLCRLKDITNLFMDTGMGSNAYSVIELKMVETILSNRADERRTMFEEAAGVNKYKLRRRLTLKKLDEVKSDLTRVNDIVTEVEKKVNSLERQAKRADKYNKLSSSLRELELDLADREYALFHRNKAEFKLAKEEAFSKKLNLESEIAKLEDEIAEIKKELYEVEQSLNKKRTDITAHTEKIHSVQQHISVSEERKKSLERNIDKYKQEIEELNYQLEVIEEGIQDNSEKLTQTDHLIQLKEKEREEVSVEVDSQKKNLELKRASLKVFAENNLNKFKEITTEENKLLNVEKSLERTNASINKLNEKIQTLTGNIAKTVGFLEELSLDKTDVEKKLAEAEDIYARKQKEKEELNKKLSGLKENELTARSIISSIKEKISFLQNLIDNLEGFSKGAKALLENKVWTTGTKNLLANIGDADEKFKFAIEAALKNNLNNILVETIDEVKRGIEYLQISNFGKASFYIPVYNNNGQKTLLQKIEDFFINRKMKKIIKENGFLGWASELIKTDEKWKPFFNKILFRIAVVENLDAAFELSKKYPDFNFTTLNGDLIHTSGVIEAGSAPKLDDTLFGRKQLLENLIKDIPAREATLNKLVKEIEQVEEQIAQIDLKVLSEKGRILINDLANVEKQISQFEYEKQKAVDEIEKSRQEIQELVTVSNSYDNERESLSSALSKLVIQKKEADEERERIEEEFKAIETEYNKIVARKNNVELEHERLCGSKKNLESSIIHGEQTLETTKRSIEKREADIKTAGEEISTLTEILSERIEELDELVYDKGKLESEKEIIDAQFKSIRENISTQEKLQSQYRKEREAAGNEVHSAEMRLNEIDFKIENLKSSVMENYSVHLELKTFEDLSMFDFNSRHTEVHGLKNQIKNLGPINLLAYSEFEEEKSRFEFLNKQRNDLLESEKDLIRTIEEINTTAQRLFLETFEKIRDNFIRIFRSLFNPGDEADLKLEESIDPLEGKIEIIAKPKGKRPTSIELLSGGEKTLTAIALLFAIYLVKPSPFCILDEIDAPLDDANVDRFTKILKEFSTSTQFIVVTHNKRTMEACDTLYGVTMQEEGVSKIVSVRFNEDLSVVA
ncbi:MAG TPA: chromosome segregation protein SMC [Ignavibacteriaceae bacterium]|nr:chromosome segregation protein SMC [Ignavibacteriaceae bacterium]